MMTSKKSKQQLFQDTPTLPRKRDAAGFELDAHDLPLSGPARAARLAKLGISDPALDEIAASAEDVADTDLGSETGAETDAGSDGDIGGQING